MTGSTRIRFALVVGLPALCFVGVRAYGIHRESAAAAELPNVLARAQALGMATSISDLIRNPPVPDDQNAARFYAEATDLANQDATIKNALDTVGRAFGPHPAPADKGKAEFALARLPGLTALVEKASLRPHCDFGFEFSKQGPDLSVTNWPTMRRFAQIAALLAGTDSQRGATAQALAEVREMQTFGRQAIETPSMSGFLVSVGIERMAHQILGQIIREHSRDGAALAEILKIELAFPPISYGRPFISCEIAVMRHMLDAIKSTRDLARQSDGSSDSGTADITLRKSLKEACEADLFSRYIKFYESLPRNPADWAGFRRAAYQCDHELQLSHSPFAVLSRLCLPTFGAFGQIGARMLAVRRMDQIAIELFRERIAGVPLPYALSPKQLAVKDPFTGSPFHYRLQGVGFVLYGLGSSGIDMGGKTQQRLTDQTDENIEDLSRN